MSQSVHPVLDPRPGAPDPPTLSAAQESLRNHWQSLLEIARPACRDGSIALVATRPPHARILAVVATTSAPLPPGPIIERGAWPECDEVLARREEVLRRGSPSGAESDARGSEHHVPVAFLGVPLLYPDGSLFGAVCIQSTSPQGVGEGGRRIAHALRAFIEDDLRPVHGVESPTGYEGPHPGSAAFYRQLVERMNDGLAQLDEQGRLVFANDRFCETIGCQRAAILGRHITEFFDEENRAIVTAHLARRRRGARDRYEVTWRRPDGTLVTTIIAPEPLFDPDGRFIGSFAVSTDISEHKKIEEELRAARAELEERVRQRTESLSTINRRLQQEITERRRTVEELRESRRTLLTLLSNLPGMVYRCRNDPQWTMEFVSEGCLPLTGYTVGQLVGNNTVTYASLIHPDDRRRVWDEVQAALRAETTFRLTYRIHRAGGEERWVWEQGQGVAASGVAVGALEGFICDITELKHTERELLESRHHLQLVMDNIPQYIFWKNRDGVYQGCNHNFARAAGLEHQEEILGKTDYDLPWRREEAEFYRACDLRVMEQDRAEFHIIESQLRADGLEVWLDTNKIPLHDAEGRVVGILGTYEDITERRRAERERAELEERLRHAQKMEAVGTLASGIAHDFNNMITVMLGATELLRKHGMSDALSAEALEMIERSLEQATGLTRSLLTFSRKMPPIKQPIDLCQVVRDAEPLLRRSLTATIGFTLELPDRAVRINGDRTQIQQVLLNLVINARDAMPQGGSLTICLCPPGDGERADGEPEFVRLIVSDTGTGIPEQDVARVFDPFFTTKPRGQGTGLGLSITHGIVKEHGGRIEVVTEPDTGSTFTIFLPHLRDDAPYAPVPPAASAPEPPLAGC
jgi:PAS domain S-box-containing protein